MATAEQLLHSLLTAIENGFVVDVPALYAANAEVTQPFAIGGPTTLRGTEEIAAHFDRAARSGMTLTVENIRVHQSVDPHVAIGEFDYRWKLPNGATLETANIQVVEERNGLISRTRDYHDSAAIRAAFAASQDTSHG